MTGEFSFASFKVDQTNFVPVLPYQTQITNVNQNPFQPVCGYISMEMQFTCINYATSYILTAWDNWLLPPQNTVYLTHCYLFYRLLQQSKRGRVTPQSVHNTSIVLSHITRSISL